MVLQKTTPRDGDPLNIQRMRILVKGKDHALVSYPDLNAWCPTERILRILTALMRVFEVYAPLGRPSLGKRLTMHMICNHVSG